MQHTPVKNNVVTSQITTKKNTEFDHMVIENVITTPCADPVEEEPESQSVLETLNDCHDFCMTALRSSSYDSDECFTMMVNAVEHAITLAEAAENEEASPTTLATSCTTCQTDALIKKLNRQIDSLEKENEEMHWRYSELKQKTYNETIESLVGKISFLTKNCPERDVESSLTELTKRALVQVATLTINNPASRNEEKTHSKKPCKI